MKKIDSYTNSCLSCFRRCPREFENRYALQLEREGDDREVLRVGSAWHHAHDVRTKSAQAAALHTGPDVSAQGYAGEPAVQISGYDAIDRRAPGDTWKEKLKRLLAAYDWFWSEREVEIVESEHTFEYELDGTVRRGQIDGIVKQNGRVGILERKTSGEDIADGSPFWARQRMGSQVSFYDKAFREITGEAPAFTLYDVVRKPTIRAKALTKAEVKRMRAEVAADGPGIYFTEEFDEESLEGAVFHGKETLKMYGARLTADIGDRPSFYFNRSLVPRTNLDIEQAELDTQGTIQLIETAYGLERFPKNPDACATFGLCDFFPVCSNNVDPREGVPSGYARREHLHPELDDK
tara:strand:- start:1539 stop:2591 length:1053 start_codon:yes stop_codon:yes gene_type:complete